jgi:hypothetical protein
MKERSSMNDISREDALEHFGVKGMHWGVRKASSDIDEQVYDSSPAKGTGHKVAKGLAIAGVITAGAIAATIILGKSGGASVASINSTAIKGAAQAKDHNVGNAARSVGRMAKAFRASGKANKAAKAGIRLVPESTRLFEGQQYANTVIKTYGSSLVPRL